MKKFIANYDEMNAPAILVPKKGHTLRFGSKGVVSRNTKGLNSARDVVARDIRELRRVYSDIPRSALRELIQMNKQMYPDAMKLMKVAK
ncbi:MAG: hypothetical protein R3B89_35450 [Polyangiaceae bacterium]